MYPFSLESGQRREEELNIAWSDWSYTEDVFGQEHCRVTAPEMTVTSEQVETGVTSIGALHKLAY